MTRTYTRRATQERETRDTAPEVRGDRGASEDAQRTDEDGLISDEEFSRVLNEEFDQTALPKPPAMPGWHLCWLTTTSAYDTIQKRQRLGYQAVRVSEWPGFEKSSGTLTGHEGTVTCNEMVLFKIREERYQQLMLHFHHKRPLQEEGGIVAAIKESASQQDSAGATVGKDLGDGITDMEESVRRGERATPTFSA